MIRKVKLSDAAEIANIYNYYIENSWISFEENKVSHDQFPRRITDVFAQELPWLVAEQDNRVVGYAYAAKWKARSAYRFSVESTVYIDKNYAGNGIGSNLYKELLSLLKRAGIHVVIGVISLPNPPSIALHEKFGFKQVAEFKEVGFKFNEWIDVGYWQLKFDS